MKTLIIGATAAGSPYYRASERIRCDWIAPHIPATRYQRGMSVHGYDVVIWVKVHPTVRMAPIQILDCCDPAWKVSPEDFRESCNHIDGVTLPTKAAQDQCSAFMGNFIPTYIVRDGHDFSWYPKPEKTGRRYVWFGYSHNFGFASDFVKTVHEGDVECVTNVDVGYGHWTAHISDYLAYKKIGESKIALLPIDKSRLKSNNREITAWALGLAVARNQEDLERFQDPSEIQKDIDDHQDLLKEHSAEMAAQDMRDAIGAIHDTSIQGTHAAPLGVDYRHAKERSDRARPPG